VSGVLPEQLTAQRAALTFKLHTQTAITGFNHSASADKTSSVQIQHLGWDGVGDKMWVRAELRKICNTLQASLCFNSHFPGEPGLAGVY